MIRHLYHDDIDKAWWDDRLRVCSNRLWYARSHVLDAASPGWEALVDDASGAMMPLAAKRKWGIHYLHQPFSIQQLGVFSQRPSPGLTGAFLNAIPDRFKLWDITLNGANSIGHPGNVALRTMTNMVIDLDAGMGPVRARYGGSHERGLRKWSGAEVAEPLTGHAFLALVLGSEQARAWGMDVSQRQALRRVVSIAEDRGEGVARGIRVAGQWAAVGFFIQDEDRHIFLKGVATAAGRKCFAMHRLIDAQIEEAAARSRLFDMAGGELAPLRRFYAGFGARPDLYLRARANRLPQPLRWYKQRSDGA